MNNSFYSRFSSIKNRNLFFLLIVFVFTTYSCKDDDKTEVIVPIDLLAGLNLPEVPYNSQ